MHYLGRSVLSFMVRIEMLVWSTAVWMKTSVGFRNAMCFKAVTICEFAGISNMLYSLKVCMKVCVQRWNWSNKYKSLPTKVASVHS